MRRRMISCLLLALLGCAGEEKSPLPYYGLPAGGTGGTGGAAGGAAGSAGASGGTSQGGAPPGDVVLNEIDPSGDPVDWIELKNRGPQPVDLSGWVVTQGYDGAALPAEQDSLRLPDGTSIQPGGYLVLYTRLSDGPGPGDFGLGKDSAERLTLFAPGGTVVDDTTTDGSPEQPFAGGTSWARWPDGDGPFARGTSTKGAENTP